jgi:hypothetical protein
MFVGTVRPAVFAVVAGDFLARPLVRQALRPLSSFVGVVVVGVTGFAVLGRVGVVEATFWLVDTTSIELHFQTHEGPATLTKAFAIAVRVALVLTGLWLGETVLTASFGDRIQEEYNRMQNEREIAELDRHVLVCGYGVFGQTVADRLSGNGRDVVVVEFDTNEAARAERDGFPTVTGDARREEVLNRAQIAEASVVVAAIDDSNANVQIAMMARQLAPNVRVVVRIGESVYESLARRAGADEVVVPEVASAERVSETIEGVWPTEGTVRSRSRRVGDDDAHTRS